MDGEPQLVPEARASTEAPFIEQVSKVKLVRNAKGDPQWEISIVEGADAAEVARIRDLAIDQDRELQSALGVRLGPVPA